VQGVWCRAYAWSYGPLAWLYPSEIQPLETRSAGLAAASFSNLLFSFVIAQTFLTMLCSLQVWTVACCMHSCHGVLLFLNVKPLKKVLSNDVMWIDLGQKRGH